MNLNESLDKIRENMGLEPTTLTEAEYEDFFFFIENDPRLNSFSTLTYLSPMDTYLSKKGFKEGNPMIGKLFKLTKYGFRFGQTYVKAAEQKAEKNGTEYIPGQRKGNYEKIEGFNVLERDSKGEEVLPIVPNNSKSKIVRIENGEVVEEMTTQEMKEKYKDFFTPSFFNEKTSSSGVDFRALKVKRILEINAGGNKWRNPHNEFKNLSLEL